MTVAVVDDGRLFIIIIIIIYLFIYLFIYLLIGLQHDNQELSDNYVSI